MVHVAAAATIKTNLPKCITATVQGIWFLLINQMSQNGENVAELLLISYIYINHIENESRYQFCA